jgi:transcriptional regulator with XRE-family HTH domain
MRLGDKLAHLRGVEGQLRGLGRPITKAEVTRLMRAELGSGVSHAYLSQLESGARVHLSAASRALLASFFKVHPGYLVDDPPDFSTELVTQRLHERDDPLPDWLAVRSEEQRSDPVVHRFLDLLARSREPRAYLQAFSEVLERKADGLKPLSRLLDRAEREGLDEREAKQREEILVKDLRKLRAGRVPAPERHET